MILQKKTTKAANWQTKVAVKTGWNFFVFIFFYSFFNAWPLTEEKSTACDNEGIYPGMVRHSACSYF